MGREIKMDKIVIYVNDTIVFQQGGTVTPPPLTPPPVDPPVIPPPNAISMTFGVILNINLGAGVTQTYSFTLAEVNKTSLKLNLYGTTPTTNATYKWILPDGTEFPLWFRQRGIDIPDTIVGSTSSGGFEIRTKNSGSPNVINYLYIPAGGHLLKITAIDGSSIKIWASLRP